jgi:hypothetical protein
MAESMPNQHVTPGDPTHHGGAAPAHPAAGSVYSKADWDAFRAEDFAAGKAVVVLMLGIFSMGVALYSTVAYFVAY